MAHAAVGGHLVEAGGELILAVEVAVGRDAEVVRDGLREGLGDRADLVVRVARDAELTARAVVLARAVLVVFVLLEEGKHLLVRPAFAAGRGPRVVVGLVAAEVEHAVHGAAAAEDLAARVRDLAVVHVALRDGLESPVALGLELIDLVDEGDHARLAVHGRGVAPACFDEEHARPCTIRESSREHTTRRSSAHYDIIEFLHLRLRQLQRAIERVLVRAPPNVT